MDGDHGLNLAHDHAVRRPWPRGLRVAYSGAAAPRMPIPTGRATTLIGRRSRGRRRRTSCRRFCTQGIAMGPGTCCRARVVGGRHVKACRLELLSTRRREAHDGATQRKRAPAGAPLPRLYRQCADDIDLTRRRGRYPSGLRATLTMRVGDHDPFCLPTTCGSSSTSPRHGGRSRRLGCRPIYRGGGTSISLAAGASGRHRPRGGDDGLQHEVFRSSRLADMSRCSRRQEAPCASTSPTASALLDGWSLSTRAT